MTGQGAAEPRAHGTRSRYVWGPDQADQPGPCRCDLCRAASTAAARHRERQILYGRWQPYVAADTAREHVRQLAGRGIGWKRAAELSGVSTGSMSKLLFGGPGERPPTRRIRRETEEKILAVTPSAEGLAASALVDATGTRRRLQALVACGYSQAALAERLGILRSNFTQITAGQVTAATGRAVTALYDELWNVAPDESTQRTRISASRSRNYARERGWAPPMAWDEDQIADPAAEPPRDWERGGRTTTPRADLIEDIVFLREVDGAYLRATPAELAMRLGKSKDAVAAALQRQQAEHGGREAEAG